MCVPIGLYPIVDSFDWVFRLLPTGITTIQLRIKGKPMDYIRQHIQQSVVLAKQYNAQLFINDYWEMALQYGAFGVHLGQSDLGCVDLKALQQAGLRLGVSTHSEPEIQTALAVKPSYIAFGPIYPTTTKAMPYSPQGVEKLARCCKKIDYPVVAIGGLHAHNIPDVVKAGVDGVAVLSAITKAVDVEGTVNTLQALI